MDFAGSPATRKKPDQGRPRSGPDLFGIRLKGRFFFICFFVCHLAGIPHSGGNPHAGKNINLKQQIDSHKSQTKQERLHCVTSF